jgi:small subunit ribosomal protein S1
VSSIGSFLRGPSFSWEKQAGACRARKRWHAASPMSAKGDFAALFEAPNAGGPRRTRLEPGQQVEGTVLAVTGGLVVLDIGMGADAKLDQIELNGRPISVGDRLRATVKNARSDGPELTLGFGRGGTQVSADALRIALNSGTPVVGSVSAAVKGGFSVDVAGVRAFCPISQMDLSFVQDPAVWVGQSLEFRVTDIRENGRNVIVSRKALLEAERDQNRSRVLENLAVGATVHGHVRSFVKAGALIDLGGLDGFVHVSELARTRVDRAEDVLRLGEAVAARVLSIETSDKGPQVRLSVKALDAEAAPQKAPEPEEVLLAKVVGHIPNGVIVSTVHGDGLVPARELELPKGADHKRAYPVGTELKVAWVHRDAKNGKQRFSVREVARVEERKNYREFSAGSGSGMGSFGDVFAGKLGQSSQAGPSGASAQSPASPASPGPRAASPLGVHKRSVGS